MKTVRVGVERPGVKPPGPGGVELGPHGCLVSAPDKAICDTILGPNLGDHGDVDLVKRRFAWVGGFQDGDNASLGAGWLTFRHRTQMLQHQVRDLRHVYVRVRRDPLDWKSIKPAPPVEPARGEGMSRADAKAAAVLGRAETAEINRIVSDRLKAAGL